MKSNLYNEKFSFGRVFVQESKIFSLWGKRWGSRRASSLWARRRTMGNRSKWRVPELPIAASQRKLLFDIHTGSRKKGQRKMWGLNGQQTNSGVTLLNCEMKWCSRAETNTDQLWKINIRRKNWRLVKFRVAFLFHDCNKNSLLLWDFLSGFLAKLKWWTTLTYIITNCYNISALSLDLHIYPVWFQPFPMLNIKKDSWTKHLFFFSCLSNNRLDSKHKLW